METVRTNIQTYGLDLQVSPLDWNSWRVTAAGVSCARLYLNANYNLEKVILDDNNPYGRRAVMELALSYCILSKIGCPPAPGTLLRLSMENNIRANVKNLMDFDKIPAEVTALSDHELEETLKKTVIVAPKIFKGPNEMIASLIREIFLESGILLYIKNVLSYYPGCDLVSLVLETKTNHHFKVWKQAEEVEVGKRLHFTPPYHPATEGKKVFCYINGSSNGCIGKSGDGVISLRSPEEARAVEVSPCSTWEYIRHPFYAEGKTLGIDFSSALCVTEAGYKELKSTICAALNLNNTYIAVIGGFNPPCDQHWNACGAEGICAGAVSPQGEDYPKEQTFCTWEYATLEREGLLDDSLTPYWFKSE